MSNKYHQVLNDDLGYYVEAYDRKYYGDIPSYVTEITETYEYEDFNLHRKMDVEWTDETPSGIAIATLTAE